MNREEFINILNNRSHLPNMAMLINEVNRMTPQNFEALAQCADKFYRMDNVPNWEEETKTMVLIANAMNNNKPQPFIDGLSNANNYESAWYMYSIQNVQDSHTSLSNSTFAQTDLSIYELPIQGWKFHISANSLADYNNLCTTVIPELKQLGVAFKMVRPEKFEYQLQTNQMGKAITIYPSPGFDINKLSPQAKAILLTDSPYHVNPIGDTQIQGRVYARYGRFQGSNSQESYITTPEGRIEYDPKKFRNVAPMFMPQINANDILSFYSQIEEKFKQTGDYKTYMQEYYTMAKSNGKSHAYAILEIRPEDINAYSKALTQINNPYTESFVVDNGKQDGKAYLFVHNSSMQHTSDIINNAMYYGAASPTRPEWDVKINRYEVNPTQAQMGIAIARNMAEQYGIGMVSAVQTGDGKIVIKCDSSLDAIFKDTCQANMLAIKEEVPKGHIRAFVEKFTGKDLSGERDVTFDAITQNAPEQNNQYYSGEGR